MSQNQTDIAPQRWPIWVVLVGLYGFLWSLAYALNNPVFEAPDEPFHLDYVNWVATTGLLPNQFEVGETVRHGHHHPLFYVLAAGVVRITGETPVVESERFQNSANLTFGGPKADIPLYNGLQYQNKEGITVVQLIRSVNALFVGLTGVFITLTLSRYITRSAAIVGGFIAVSIPQFQFIGGAVNNDILAACLCAATFFVMLRMPKCNTWNSVAVGVLVGLSILTKKSCLMLLVPVITWTFSYYRSAFDRLRSIALVLSVILAVCGWWFVRNQMLYGELLGNHMEKVTLPQWVDEKSLLDPYFRLRFWEVTARSFFGHFGWMNVTLSLKLLVPLGLIVFGLVGLGFKHWSQEKLRPILITNAFFMMATICGLVYYNLTYTQPQGRLLFPAMISVGVLCGLGAEQLSALIKSRTRLMFGTIAAALVMIDIGAFKTNQNFYHPEPRLIASPQVEGQERE